MSALAAAAEELLVAALIGEKVFLPSKSRMDWAVIALSLLLAVGGVFLLVLGLDLFLEKKLPPDMAALVSAAILFATAFLAMAAAHRPRPRQQQRFEAASDKLQKDIHTLIEGICTELEGPVQDNPKTAVLLAAFMGFLTAQQRIR